MKSLLRLSLLFWTVYFLLADYYTLDLAVTKYTALNYAEVENMEHLSYTFDFCLCPRNYSGLFPNKAKECQCVLQQRGRKVIESIPHAAFSASCVNFYTPAKCMNAKFNVVLPDNKIYVRVTIGKTIFTYPSWQNLVNSRFKTISTLSSAAGSDMRITYVSILRRISGDYPAWAKPVTTAPTSTMAPWMRAQPSESLAEETFDPLLRNDIFDIIRGNYNKKNNKQMKSTPQKWGLLEGNEINNKPVAPVTTTPRPVAWQPWTRNPLRIFTTTPQTIRNTYITTTRPTATATKPVITTRRTTVTTTTSRPVTRRPTVSRRRPFWDLTDVAYIRNIRDVTNFMLGRSLVDKVSPIGYDVQTVKDKLVFYHNLYRNQHDAPVVRENSYLDKLAQRYSDQLARTRSCLVHEFPRVYGENLFVYGSRYFPDPEIFAKAVTQSFYMEGYSYNYNSWYPRSYHRTGHFTQLVWKESQQIGIGISIVQTTGRSRGPCFPNGPAYMIYVCVKYDPAGNYETKEAYKRNVLPLKRF